MFSNNVIYIRVLKNTTKVEIDIWPFILVLDLVHRSQKTFVEIFRCNIKISTFALKF